MDDEVGPTSSAVSKRNLERFLRQTPPFSTLLCIEGSLPSIGILTKKYSTGNSWDKLCLVYFIGITCFKLVFLARSALSIFEPSPAAGFFKFYHWFDKILALFYLAALLTSVWRLREFFMTLPEISSPDENYVAEPGRTSKNNLWLGMNAVADKPADYRAEDLKVGYYSCSSVRILSVVLTVCVLGTLAVAVYGLKAVTGHLCEGETTGDLFKCGRVFAHALFTYRVNSFPDLFIFIMIFIADEFGKLAKDLNAFLALSKKNAGGSLGTVSWRRMQNEWVHLHAVCREVGRIFTPTWILILSNFVLRIPLLAFVLISSYSRTDASFDMALLTPTLSLVTSFLVLAAISLAGQRITNQGLEFVEVTCLHSRSILDAELSLGSSSFDDRMVETFLVKATALGSPKVELGEVCVVGHSLTTAMINAVMTYYIVFMQSNMSPSGSDQPMDFISTDGSSTTTGTLSQRQ